VQNLLADVGIDKGITKLLPKRSTLNRSPARNPSRRAALASPSILHQTKRFPPLLRALEPCPAPQIEVRLLFARRLGGDLLPSRLSQLLSRWEANCAYPQLNPLRVIRDSEVKGTILARVENKDSL